MINTWTSSHGNGSLLSKGLLLCTSLLLLASCATRIRIPEELEPEQLLPEGAMAYLRVSPAMADELILPLIEPYGLAQTEDLVKRTESMVLAVMPNTDGLDDKTRLPVVYGVVSGKFPSRSLALKLNIDRHWIRENYGWVHKEEGFRLALGSQGQIMVGTAPLETMLKEGQVRPHPIPEFWSAAWANDLAVYIPEPLSFLGSSLPVDPSGLPLESMLLSIRRMDARYEVFMGFEFATERTALVFGPLCRLFLYALARGLWPEQAPAVLATVSWSTQGVTVGAAGLRLEAAQLASLLALPFGVTRGASVSAGQTGGFR